MPERLNRGRSGGKESTRGRALRAILVACAVAGGVGAEITEAQLIQWQPVGSTGPSTIIANRIIVPPGETSIELELRLSSWDQADGAPRLGSYQATVASAGYASGSGDPLVPLGWPASPGDGGFIALQVCSDSGIPCTQPQDCAASGGTCIANPRFVFSESAAITVVSTATLDYQWGATATGGCKEDDGQSYYGGTLVLVVPAGARGTYTIGFDGGESATFFNDCAGSRIPGLSTIPALVTVLTVDDCAVDGPSTLCQDDCNANGICDLCEIADGSSDDCNGNSVPDPCDLNLGESFDCNNNGVPDECESDCNGNGIHDDCDVANETSDDCNANGVPDECEPDCQPNGVADACDLLFGSSTDCNDNGVPDECEPDCQPNGLADECDLLFGISTDCDGNGTPDECEEDCDGNGVPDVCESPTDPQIAWRPKRSSAVFALCGDEILVAQGSAQVELELLLSGWRFAPGNPTLGTYQATLDAARLAGDHPDNLAAGTTAGVDLQPAVGVHGKADGAFIILRTCASSEDSASTGQRCDLLSPPLPPCNPGEICLANPEFVFAGIVQIALASTSPYLWGAVTSLGLCRTDDGRSGHYAGTLILEVPPNATGTYTIGFDSRIAATFLSDCAGNSIPDVLLKPARIRIARCGDGLIELEEECDDGNTDGRDGCSGSCTTEETWECIGAPSVCTTTCGDGVLDPGETCDDGDRRDGDGCSSACRVEAQCERTTLTGSDGSAGDWFGAGSAISGDFAVVGSPRFDGPGSNSGKAYVFAHGPEGWRQQTGLVGSATVGGDTFGSAVALRGDRAVIGSPGGGRTYVFQRFGDAWIEQAGLLPPQSADGDEFGTAVAVDGDYIVVGASRDDHACEADPVCDSGSAHVFRLGPGGWVHQAQLTASDAQAGDRFGISVSISGDLIAVGAHWDDPKGSRSGSVYLFRFDGSQWNEEAMLTASDGAGNDQFGRAVSLDGNSAVVGAWFNDDSATNAGAVYVFEFDGADWIEEAKLVASDPHADDDFGASVTIDGDLIVVGATGNDDACDDDPGCNSGSAYVFRRESSVWVQAALINASNAAPGDRLGWSVSASDGRAVIGARTAAIGEDANRGAAYVFAIGGDCNNNTIPDVCDLSTGLRPDCNENGIPDDCDPDGDGDGIPDDCDVCPGGDDALDADGDGVADFCDPCPIDNPDDTDGDGVCDADDACPSFDDRLDADGDGVPDGCDVCPEGDDALDGDGDGVADACDPCPLDAPNDTDGDGVCDSDDACPGFDDGADCDTDGVPDGCEPDCQPNGVPDDCEIVAGTSADANGNNVPDECDPGSCCHGDGTCDVSLQTDCLVGLWSLDGVCLPNSCPQPGACCNVDGVCGMTLKDECLSHRWLSDRSCEPNPCVEPPRPAAYPHDRAKNRYISFDPNPANAGIPTALRVELKSLALGSCDGNGAPCRIERGGADCGRCSDRGDACITAQIDCNPIGQSCDLSGDVCVNDQAGSVGSIWWVGPESPLGNGVHLLVGETFREIRSDWPSVVHVGDCEVVPVATYGVRVVDLQHGFESPELEVQTIQRPATGQWADAVGTRSFFCDGDIRDAPCDAGVESCAAGQACTPAWPPPDGAVDFDDLLAAVFAFVREPGRPLPHTTWVDMHGAGRGRGVEDPPDFVPNLTDVQFIILAFEGRPYPFSDPADCPDVATWPQN